MIAHLRPIFIAFMALAFGIWLSKLVMYDSIWFGIAVVIIAALCFFFLGLYFAFKKCKFFEFFYRIRIHLIIMVIAIMFGSGLYLIMTAVYTVDFYPTKNHIYGVSGVVDTNYIQTQNGTYFFISDVNVYSDKTSVDLKRNMYVYMSHPESGPLSDDELKMILPGNHIFFTSQIALAPVFDYDKINSFAYKNNYQHVAYPLIENITVIDGKMGVMDSIREHIRGIYKQHMDERYAGLAFSVLIGDRTELADDIQDNFAISGIAHVVAVSGLNTAFIMMLLLWVLSKARAKKWIKLTVVIIVLLLYALLCDMTPSVVRASLMSVFLLIGNLFGKQSDKLNSISLSGIIVLLFSPLYIFDLSFLLSYSGVFGIFLLYPIMQKAFKFLKWKLLVDSVALTVAATIGSAPLIINAFGYFSIIGLLANLILVPLFGYAFMILFFLTLIALIIPPAAYLFTLAQYGFWLVDKGALLFAIVPFASVRVPATSDWAMVSYYLGTFTASRYCLIEDYTKVTLTTVLFTIYFVEILTAVFGTCSIIGILLGFVT